MTDGVPEQVKTFVFHSNPNRNSSSEFESLEVLIPEQLQASYSFYTWPSAPVLAWYLWERRTELLGKHIVELGAGTALPGIVAAKCGASVTLTESATLPRSIQHLRRCCELNNLQSNQVRVVGLTWGLFLANTFTLGPIDLIIGSDCFYEPSVFEDIIVTVAFLLESNPQARFYCVYQERSADWSIEHLLHKWSLRCEQVSLNNLGAQSGIDVNDLMKSHTIQLLEITRV
ncbi:probable methyltransferase-like protein 23 [Homalodisca vitripennis]|uniref:probable methyltransferase-like protein 23 n=1 Tax=Homalodisca vitripennis TaxID=197043 RepID=UPI001EEB3788|nr:probable methyltransferase-like protein 23 [Homalodisca vitripennis]